MRLNPSGCGAANLALLHSVIYHSGFGISKSAMRLSKYDENPRDLQMQSTTYVFVFHPPNNTCVHLPCDRTWRLAFIANIGFFVGLFTGEWDIGQLGWSCRVAGWISHFGTWICMHTVSKTAA